ncbi:hypothetical protein [Shewanella sp. GD03713]|uniref:hypothetical protein n=1 Tax=Shewanella sp. GD03713 TaxID=2975372 RepID=UPI000B341949|nr:hypothetical protein [Shewanella sp. GD03713]MDH1469612.1 hypothetical protein [Shewanella sp. GD03713]QXN23857.1 hypothetical protein KVP08_014840 [Shewanella putrefaciens]
MSFKPHNSPKQSLEDMLCQAAHSFRLGKEAQGSVEFRLCLDSIEKHHPELMQLPSFQQMLAPMLQAQELHDWLSLADYLEHELIELLKH